MDKNRIGGVAKQMKGSVKEAIGKVTGDTRTQAEGIAEKNLGKVQAKAGEIADKPRAGPAGKPVGALAVLPSRAF